LPGIAGGDEHRAAWRAYVRARAYLAGMNRGEASWPEHIDLAAQAVLEAGLEYRPGMTDPTVKEDLQ